MVYAGEPILAADIPIDNLNTIGGFYWIRKTATETLNTNSTLQNDDHIVVTLPTTGTYLCELITNVSNSSGTAADIKTTWVLGADVTQVASKHILGPAVATTDVTDGNMRASVHNVTTTVNYGVAGSTSSSIREWFIVSTNGSNTSIQWQWAQQAATAVDTTVGASTVLMIRRIG